MTIARISAGTFSGTFALSELEMASFAEALPEATVYTSQPRRLLFDTRLENTIVSPCATSRQKAFTEAAVYGC
jgi:hypothetical protein